MAPLTKELEKAPGMGHSCQGLGGFGLWKSFYSGYVAKKTPLSDSWLPFYRLNLLVSETVEGGWEDHSKEYFGDFLPHESHSIERHVLTGVVLTILAL